jgi:lysozyme family protein
MQDLKELQKKAQESLANQQGLIRSSIRGDEFSPEEIAAEMERLQAQEADKQKFEQQNQEEMQQQSDAELDERIAKSQRLSKSGLNNFDPKLAEHAFNIFPSLKQFGMKPEVSPMVEQEEETSREPAAVEEEEEQVPDDAIKSSILETEGGYSDIEEDKGGATNKGITLETYSNFLGRPASKEELQNISDKEVNSIFGRYYNEAGGDKIKDPRVREVLVDQNYNKGTNFLNRVNDMLGTPRGTSLSQEAIDKINSTDPDEFLKQVLSSEREIYKKIAEKDPSQQKFSAGWDKRILDLAKKTGINLEEERMSREPEPQNIEELLKKAREKEDRASTAKQFAGLRDAIIGVGAGRVIASDTSSYDERKAKAMRPINDILLKDELESKQAKSDPNSQLSKLMRKSLEEMGISMKGFEKVPYAQLEKLYPTFSQALYNKLSIEAKKGEAVRKATEKAEAKLEKLDQKKQKDMTDHINFSINNLKKSYENYSKSQTALDSVSNILAAAKNKITPGTSDVTLLYSFISGLDPASTVREGEIALSKSAMSLWGKIKQGTLQLSGGDLLDSDTRKSIEEIMKVIQSAREKQFAKQKANLIEAGVGKGLDKTILNSYIYPEVDAISALSKKKELTPEERLQKYEEMINRASELQKRDTRNKKGN